MTSAPPNQVNAMGSRSRRASARPREAGDFSIVAIGASAGGLEAATRLLDSLRPGSGLALILVQHLDPTHASMMVELLSHHTSMIVQEATDGLAIERDHLYVIPPGFYISVANGVLHLSTPEVPRTVRLPFDFLLQSLAPDSGARTICVILSGTGHDGSLGLKAVKEHGGLVIAQDPDQAAFDGMPRNAVMTGAVDLVLPVAEIAEALSRYHRRMTAMRTQIDPAQLGRLRPWLPEVVDILHTKTGNDFRLYKHGTLQRRIERRMAMTAIDTDQIDHYLEILRSDPHERDLLAKDLLINVTSFFRDPKVFDFLARKVLPDLVHRQPPDQPLRVWIAGCSTGEEAYSLAILLREEIAAAKRDIKLQILASDLDADAVATARDGLYPRTIEAEVSSSRLARFFAKENNGYRVVPELRDAIVFTIQDVLADPPFARLDLISCRNLLIYLNPEAQAKVMAAFHFALREGGILLLGTAETAGDIDGRYQIISKAARTYRRIGGSQTGEFRFSAKLEEGTPAFPRRGSIPPSLRQAGLADLFQRSVMEFCAPAAVLIDHKHQCLYSSEPADRYLRMAPGASSHDLLAMLPVGLRIKLQSAIHKVVEEKTRVIVDGGRTTRDRHPVSFSIGIQPIPSDGEELLLVWFTDAPQQQRVRSVPLPPHEASRVAELEHELAATRMELQGAIRNLEDSTAAALSANQEYQAANEELLTSKEELQSLNEELTALNSQLQETLDRQRTISDDIQNILYSTDVATLFLDTKLNIRFFTPATRSLFRIISSDVGRPLADFRSLSNDPKLLDDAEIVLRSQTPIEREIEGPDSTWHIRRAMPYRTQDNGVAGVVITFTDITERKRVATALEVATREAEHANIAKSRFLAAANHDLRQPLQTLALIQGVLARTVEGEAARKLVMRQDEALTTMSDMLNRLLDINHVETGTIHAEIVNFPINDLLDRLRSEYSLHAETRGLTFEVVPCSLSVASDPRLLEEIIRNLLSNALKYTKRGKVLVGCRRLKEKLSIEVWDTGVGIPEAEQRAIFDEHHRIDNPDREQIIGHGLGLSIVQLLADMLDHRVVVRSQLGKGSMFSVEVALAAGTPIRKSKLRRRDGKEGQPETARRVGSILIIEDDPDVGEFLELALKGEGHLTISARDGTAALELLERSAITPDVVLTDFNLPGGMSGLQVVAKIREKFRRELPAIILTGDISTATTRNIALQKCLRLSKPLALDELTKSIAALLPGRRSETPAEATKPAAQAGSPGPGTIFIVDDDRQIRDAVRATFEGTGRVIEDYETCEAFLEAYRPGREACLLIDAYLPGMSGLQLLQNLKETGRSLPSIMITGHSDIPTAVEAMRAGALDFVEKPVSRDHLVRCVDEALEIARDSGAYVARRAAAASRLASLTPRQNEVLKMVLAGCPSKNIAADLGISQRTVENHRAVIMRRMGAKSLPELARLALAAISNGSGEVSAAH